MKSSIKGKKTKTNAKKHKKITKKKRVKKGGNGNEPDNDIVDFDFDEFGQSIKKVLNSDTESVKAPGPNNDQEEEENSFNKKTFKNMAIPSFIVVAFIGGIVALASTA